MNRLVEKTIDFGDYEDILSLKSELINSTSKELVEAYSDEEDFLDILYTTKDLLEIDNCAFALLSDELINKIYTLINIKRFEIRKTHPEEFKLINELIEKLNRANRIDYTEKEEHRKDYLIHEEINRGLKFHDYNAFLFSLGVDIFVLDYLEGEEIPEEIEDVFILGSILSLNKKLPDLFDDPHAREKIETLLNQIENQSNQKLTVRLLKQKVLKR